jgi:hypothetical protein
VEGAEDTEGFDAYLQYLFDAEVRPRLDVKRENYGEIEWVLPRLRESDRMLSCMKSIGADPYRTFTPDALATCIGNVEAGVRVNNQLLDETALSDLLDRDIGLILTGLRTRHLAGERELLTALGFPEVARHLPAMLYLARQSVRTMAQGAYAQLVGLAETLYLANRQHAQRSVEVAQAPRPVQPEEPDPRVPAAARKSRRWFDGLGQVLEGVAISIADIALAIGALDVPVAREAGVGTIASTAMGVSRVLGGIGDLGDE